MPAIQFKSAEERDSFDFFTSYAISSLKGVHESPFWQREVLQAAHRDTAIQHCVIALGAMHRRFFEGTESRLKEEAMTDTYLQFALRQSNQAIVDLVRKKSSNGKMAKLDRMTLMTCSVLFSSMCCLQGYQKDAFLHLRSGIQMLNEMDSEENGKIEEHPINTDSLRSILVALDMQARSIMSSAQAQTWVTRPKAKLPTLAAESELNKTSLLALLHYFESLLNHVHQFFPMTRNRSGEDAEDLHLEYQNLLSRFHEGAAVLEMLQRKALEYGDAFSQTLVALQLLKCQLEYLVRCPRPDVESKFGFVARSTFDRNLFAEYYDVDAEFFQIFELATRLLPITPSVTPIFTTSIGPISALWLVALRAPSHCADLRKRAVRIMLSHPRREGFWDGMVAGQVAQEALRLEQINTQAELGLPFTPDQDLLVPDDLRTMIVAVQYADQDDRKAMVEFSNSRDLAVGCPGSVQWLAW